MSVTIKRWTEDGPDIPAGYVVGVDFGQARDFSAIAVNEVHCFERQSLQQDQFHAVPAIARRATLRRHQIRFIERMPLGTSYPDVVRRCCEVMDRLPAIPGRGVDGLAVDPERLTAGREYAHPRARAQDGVDQPGAGVDEVLAVVEHHHGPSGAHLLDERRLGRVSRHGAKAKSREDCVRRH